MKRSIFIFVLMLLAFILFSNELINSDYDYYYKYLELTGRVASPSITFHSFSTNDWIYVDSENPWMERMNHDRSIFSNDWMSLSLLDPEILLTANSYHQWGMNDGSMWQGKGVNSRLQAGLSWETKYITVTFYPQIWLAQNLTYSILPAATGSSNSYAYFNDSRIDLPQKMGDSPLFQFDWGQTDIRLEIGKFTLGFSTEEIWLGPSQKNALILSNNSGGFPHFDFGFGKINTKIGSFEARYFCGVISESNYYNTFTEDNFRLFSAATLGLNLIWIPGLNLGFNWSVQTPGGNFEAADFFIIPLTLLGQGESNYTNDNDQKFSITLDWKFPEVGFEFYGELAWEDFNSSPLQIPDHTLFFTFGGIQVIEINEQCGFLLNIEYTDLRVSDSQRLINSSDSTSNYYVHSKVRHGYTNSGQILGAGIGPGADSQYFSLKYYDIWGAAEFYVFRHNKDKTYVTNDVINNSQYNLNVELSFGLSSLVFLGPFDLNAEFVLTYEKSHLYIEGNDIFNIHGELGLRYRY